MHSVEVEVVDGVIVIAARGELDAFAAPDLTAALPAPGERTRVIVDLDSVTFLDSTALGVVVHAIRDVSDAGGGTRVVLPRGAARRIFELTTLDRVLPLATSRSEALAALRSAA
jgi:anti-sigma B factor antagonist